MKGVGRSRSNHTETRALRPPSGDAIPLNMDAASLPNLLIRPDGRGAARCDLALASR